MYYLHETRWLAFWAKTWQGTEHLLGQMGAECPLAWQNTPFKSRARRAVLHLGVCSQPHAASTAVELTTEG